MKRTYEKSLPQQYKEIAHIRFDDMKTGFGYDLKAILPGIVLTALGCIVVKPTLTQSLVSLVIFVVAIYPYFSLHELVHGMVVKLMTKQSVEIGFNKSGAYCGMPDIYMYRKLAVNCTAAPLVAFSILFGVSAIILIVLGHWSFLPLGLLATLHLLGCRSDVNLLKELKKHQSELMLVKDTGTEQFFYDE